MIAVAAECVHAVEHRQAFVADLSTCPGEGRLHAKLLYRAVGSVRPWCTGCDSAVFIVVASHSKLVDGIANFRWEIEEALHGGSGAGTAGSRWYCGRK